METTPIVNNKYRIDVEKEVIPLINSNAGPLPNNGYWDLPEFLPCLS
jgi:hypothetical protein